MYCAAEEVYTDQRDRGGRGSAAPPLFEKGGIAPQFFWQEMTTYFLQQCLCKLKFTGQKEISNCLLPHFLVPATQLQSSVSMNAVNYDVLL